MARHRRRNLIRQRPPFPATRVKKRRQRGWPFFLALLALLVAGVAWADKLISPRLLGLARAEYGAVEKVVKGRAVLLRDEQVFVAPLSGLLKGLVREGERVRVGTPVVEISNPATSQLLEKELKQIEGQLARLQQDSGAEMSRLEKEVEDIDRLLKTRAEALKQAVDRRQAERSRQLEEEIRSLNARKGDLMEKLQPLREARDEMLRRKADREALLEKQTYPMTSPLAGVVSFGIDGWEETLRPAGLSDLKPDHLPARNPAASGPIERGRVTAAEPVFKIIDNLKVTLAVVLPAVDAAAVARLREVRLRFPQLQGQMVEARVSDLGREDDRGQAVVSLVTGQYLDGFTSWRVLDAEVVLESTEGIVLPGRALVKREGRDGVYIIRDQRPYWKEVKVRATGDRQVVVEGLTAGTVVVTNPRWVRGE